MATSVSRIAAPDSPVGCVAMAALLTTAVAAILAACAAAGFAPGWPRMVAAVAAMFFGFKAATLFRVDAQTLRRTDAPTTTPFIARTFPRLIAYLFLWPGMDPTPFTASPRPTAKLDPCIALGAGKMAAGAAILLIALRIDLPLIARVWLAMAAVLLIVHMGLFDVLAGFWRRVGFPVERICPGPWRSVSVSEFWARRWNVAFHAFARDCVYRPVARRFGRTAAIAAVFLVSGLAHELAISFPAGGGYGLPTLYFALHGAIVLFEKCGWLTGRRWTTAFFVIGPLPFLFHPAFIANVVLPLSRGAP